MPERELIEYLRQLGAADRPPWLRIGLGDDAAVAAFGIEGLIATTDMVIEGVHFEAGTAMESVGWKAIARCLSDVAAMAGRPFFTMAAVAFPTESEDEQCTTLLHALWDSARQMDAPLIGGDIAAGVERLSVTVTALATPGPAGPIGRGGARPGDALCVTGRLGGSILGRHLRFRPRIREALELADRCGLHALIDISDGLSTDALHVAAAGGHGLLLRAEHIPVSDDACTLAEDTGREPLWHAMNDGEDYELLFCLPLPQGEQLQREGLAGLEVHVIGEVAEESGSHLVLPDGRRQLLRPGGWEHLSR